MRTQVIASIGIAFAAASTAAATVQWRELSPNATNKPPHRLGAAMTPLADEEGVLVFAGCSSSCCYDPLDDVWVWTTARNGWQQLQAPATGPGARLYHTFTALNNSALLVGGSSVAQEFLGDVWLLPVNTGLGKPGAVPQWGKLPVSVPSRAGHTATLLPATSSSQTSPTVSVVVAGGRNLTNVLDDVWIIRTTPTTWAVKQIPTTGWAGLVNHVAAPVLLQGGSAAGVAVVGGTDGLGQDNAALLLLDVSTGLWQSQAALPSGERHGSVVWSVSSRGLLLFGGQQGEGETAPYLGDLWSLTLEGAAPQTLRGSRLAEEEELQGSSFNASASQPVVREDAAAATSGPQGSQQRWLFGGFSGYGGGLDDRLHNDLWVLAVQA